MSSAKAAAADYAKSGFCPIPIKERSKQTSLVKLAPYLERKATREELSSWSWSGVGIVTGPLSGVLVLDVDGPEGEAELKKHGHPITPMVRTAGGGMHLYFRYPDRGVRTGIRVAPGLDVKASGGYVVAPPSLGPSGQPYEWIVSPEDAELANPPEWLMQLLGARSGQHKGPAAPVGEQIPSGERNKVLTSMAGTMRRRGMEEAEILAALQVANERRCAPPLETSEVERIAHSIARYEPADEPIRISMNEHGSQHPPTSFNNTDLGNAARLIAHHGQDLRYCYPWGKWLVWDGRRWRTDDTGEVYRRAKKAVSRIYQEAAAAADEETRKALAKHAMRSEGGARIKDMVDLARPEVPILPDALDADPWLLNCENGTIDLRTGELREHRREDLITKIAPVEYDPEASAPVWEAFLQRILPGGELRKFVQKAAGYGAAGDTSEQCLFINYGTGANGKSTLQETIHAALGDYARRTPTETLLAKRNEGVPNDVARLKGARFVTASETEGGRRLAESTIKDLTGQDTISARFMRAEWFDFKPTHKLWLSTNHKPVIAGTDNAIWRRIRLVPFDVAIPPTEQDRKLSEKLRAELPGVLAWIVAGCTAWQREGLQAPDEVRKATGEYRSEMDVLGDFLTDRCIEDPDVSVPFNDLWKEYRSWCLDAEERAEPKKRFGMSLTERGFVAHKGSRGVRMRRGLRLKGGNDPDSCATDEADSGSYATPQKTCKTPDKSRSVARSGSSLRMNTINSESRGVDGEKEPHAPHAPHDEEQQREIQRLIKQGFSEYAPRAQVLAADHPLDCDCEVCE